MGQCFRATPYKSYAQYFEMENPASLKEQWPPIKMFKLKKLFEARSHAIETHERVLSYESFVLLLPELAEQRYSTYRENHKRRLFALFDHDNVGYLTWNHFLMGYTLCEFGSQEFLALLMFAIFDDDLKHRLTHDQLSELLSCNSKYLREEEGSLDIDEETVFNEMMKHRKLTLTLQEWLNEAEIYLDFTKFKKMFNVWAEQDLQKDMAQNFSELNELYDQQRNKHIGYLVNYKWFQSWKTYIHKEYNLQINGFSNNLTYNRTMRTLRTQKSFKTKKTIRSLKSTKSIRSSKSIHSIKSLKRTIDCPRLREIVYEREEDDHMTQYNLVYSNIGDKPTEIYNNLLEGEFSEILIPELIQNIHYVIVSQEVWRRLKLIYGAYPQFRRTGEKAIEIYPKNFKIYSKFHKGRIDFQEEKICEFSNFIPINLLISKAMDLDIALAEYRVFYKTCSMFKWQELLNLDLRTFQVSSEQIIFLSVVPREQSEEFAKINCQPAELVRDIHVGDQFIYSDPVEKIQRRAIFMGRSKGKMIVHFRGSSYIYDLCVDREDFLNRSFLSKRATDSTRNKVKLQDLQLVGLPNSKGLGFINSMLLCLFSNEDMFRILATYHRQAPSGLIQYLSNIAHTLANSYQARPVVISDMIRKYFYEFLNFQFTMCEDVPPKISQFIDQFFDRIHDQFSRLNFINFQNPAQDYLIQVEQVARCTHCKRETSDRSVFFSIILPIPNEEVKYYEIIYVPFAYSLKAVQIRRYAFSLPKNSTYKEYKQAFQKTAQLKNPHYFLAEIHGNNIIKNYLNAKDQATLQDLLLREDDLIFAYELCFRLDGFITDHYSNQPVPKMKNLKVGMMLDFQSEKTAKRISSKKKVRIDSQRKHEGRGIQLRRLWNFGKISKIQVQPYTHRWMIQIQHRQNRLQSIISVINPQKTNISSFPTRSYLNCEQYHLRLLNRLYNEVTNEMQLCNIPMVVMVAGWMRTKEVELLVYQQVRHMIADNYKFKISEEGYQLEEGQSKINKKEKMKKFKEYLYNGNKPYRITFTDLQGRCSICCKIQKSQVCDNQEEFICQGCELDPETPIYWQIRPYQSRVCVDWYSLDSFVKPEITEHNSYTITKAARKNSVESLQECMKERLKVLGEAEECCCSFTGQKKMQYCQKILNVPQRLVFLLDRMIEQQQNYKHINRKYIHFQIDDMLFSGQCYQLVAATSIEGSQVDSKFITYLRQKNHWLEYNGEHVKMVKKTAVQKVCALMLQYRRVIKNEKRMATMRD